MQAGHSVSPECLPSATLNSMRNAADFGDGGATGSSNSTRRVAGEVPGQSLALPSTAADTKSRQANSSAPSLSSASACLYERVAVTGSKDALHRPRMHVDCEGCKLSPFGVLAFGGNRMPPGGEFPQACPNAVQV